MISKPTPKERPDLTTDDRRDISWVEVPNCTITGASQRAYNVASSCWQGHMLVPITTVHQDSDARNLWPKNFGSMIILRSVAIRLGIMEESQ